MAEQTEIKKVITVDLGNTATSLKEYKKHIDDLKGSLLQLDETSEEYNKIAQEITDEQNKLNDVMKVGKSSADAADGSYNKLVETMSELKKQWRATADTIERDELGKKILEINNQLKDLDASTGNFQRNVGDYGNAFEEAFKNCLDGISSLDGPISQLGGDIKKILPLIKSVNTTALKGLKGIKAAIAGTGIGLLIIGITELITHWDDLRKLIGISDEQIQKFKDNVMNFAQNAVIMITGVGNAIAQYMLAPINTAIELFKGLGQVLKDVYNGEFDKIKGDVNATTDAIVNINKAAFDFKSNFASGQNLAAEWFKNIKDKANAAATAVTDASGTIYDMTAKLQNNIEKIGEGKGDAKDVAKITQELQDRYRNELILEEQQYQERKKLFEQFNIDTTELTKQHQENVKAIIDKSMNAQFDAQKKVAKKKRDEDKENAEYEKKLNELKCNAMLSASASLMGSMSDLYEEGSDMQKGLAVAETTIATIQGAMNAISSFATLGPWGIAAGSVAATAITAQGVASVKKILATKPSTSGSGSSSTVQAPSVSTSSTANAVVSPLIDETADYNRFETSGLQGDSTREQQNLRVYVVDQDIRDANHRAEVVESNATF